MYQKEQRIIQTHKHIKHMIYPTTLHKNGINYAQYNRKPVDHYELGIEAL